MFKFLKSDWMVNHFSDYKLYRRFCGGSWKEYILLDTYDGYVTLWIKDGDVGVPLEGLRILNEEIYD